MEWPRREVSPSPGARDPLLVTHCSWKAMGAPSNGRPEGVQETNFRRGFQEEKDDRVRGRWCKAITVPPL
jgi:hypothetical protein